jgi:hypothetical protein
MSACYAWLSRVRSGSDQYLLALLGREMIVAGSLVFSLKLIRLYEEEWVCRSIVGEPVFFR